MRGFYRKGFGLFELEKRLMFDASLPAIAGQVLWLDASDSATVLDADGDRASDGAGGAANGFDGAVATWQDKSGSGFHVTSSGTERPQYGVNSLNGHDVITLDGSNDRLRNLTASVAGDDVTYFIVFNRTTASARDAVFELGGGGSRNGLFINDGSGPNRMNYYINGAFRNFTSTYTAGTYTMASIVQDGTAISLMRDGTTETTTTGGLRATTTGIYIGDDSTSGDQLQGNIAEFIVYDRNLSDTERHAVENYLAAKWGLTAANAAPAETANTGASVDEGAAVTLGAAMLTASDADNSAGNLTYTITDAVDHGTFRNTDTGLTLGLGDIFTQADINSGFITYTHNGSENFSDSLSFTLSDGLDSYNSTFSITVNPVNEAPVIDGWTLVSSEDFESGATGWNNNTTSNGGANVGNHLGRFSNDGGVQSNFKTYTLTGAQDYTVVQFDFLRFDTWDNEAFRIFVNDTQIFTQNFNTNATTIADGSSGIVSWVVTEINSVAGNLGYGSSNDQAFRFTMTIQNSTDNSVKIGFGSTTNQAVNDESWGIDNVKIYEAGDGGTPGDFSVAENTPNGQVVGRITAGDPEGDTITYTITGGTGLGAFAIDSATGIITVANSSLLNYETTPSFTLQITATDNGSPNLTDVETVTINLIDRLENTAPVVAAAGPFTVSEDAAVNTIVGTVSATDAEGNAITWSISGGNTDNIFAINNAGQIRIANTAALNFEWDQQYTITVRAADNGFGALAGTRNITINITDVNEAPTFDSVEALLANDPYLRYNTDTGNFYKYVSTTANFNAATAAAAASTLNGVGGHLVTITSAAENAYVRALGTAQIWLGASDAATEQTWVWLAGGAESGMTFWQGNGTGSVQNGLYANWNTNEPNSASEDFAVMLTNGRWNDISGGNQAYVIEWEGADVLAAAAALDNGPFTVNENSANGTSVGTAEAFDADSDTLSYTITGGTGSGLFQVDAATGAITVNGPLNYEAQNSYTLIVRATDDGAGGLYAERTINLSLADVNDVPEDISLSSTLIAENQPANTLIGTLSTTDQETTQTHTYSLLSNPGNKFVLVGDQLRLNGPIDFEATPSLNVTIRTNDGAGGVFDKTFTISVQDIFEPAGDGFIPPSGSDDSGSSGTSGSLSGDPLGPGFIEDEIFRVSDILHPASRSDFTGLIRASLGVDGLSLDRAFYGDGAQEFQSAGNDTYETLLAAQASDGAEQGRFISTADLSQFDVGAPGYNESYTNIREQLAALERLQAAEGTAGSSQEAPASERTALAALAGREPGLYDRFSDVLTYHEAREQRLRDALVTNA